MIWKFFKIKIEFEEIYLVYKLQSLQLDNIYNFEEINKNAVDFTFISQTKHDPYNNKPHWSKINNVCSKSIAVHLLSFFFSLVLNLICILLLLYILTSVHVPLKEGLHVNV